MKIVKVLFLVVLLLFCIGGTASAGDALIVSGKDFSFKATEPVGWDGMTADANRYRVNVYFRMPGYDFNTSPALMYVRVLYKNGLSVSQHLEADMEAFARKKSVAFEDFAVSGLSYGQAAKKYLIGNNQVDFLCYVDPGEKVDYYVIFVLTAPSDLAEKNRDAFMSLVKSFNWL